MSHPATTRPPLRAVLASGAIFFVCALWFISGRGSFFTKVQYLPSANNIQVDRPNKEDAWASHSYVSSDAKHPELRISRFGHEPLAEGYIFLAPHGALERTVPYIFTSDGELVYAATSADGYTAVDFRVQTYQGRPHLTFWRGDLVRDGLPGHSYGEVVFLDDEYEGFTVTPRDVSIQTIRPTQNPGIADLHEQEVTEWDTLLVTAYNNTPYDLRPVRGPEDGWVVDSLFYELDVATGAVLFSWSALEHVDMRTSHLPILSYLGDGSRHGPYDFFHITNVQAVGRDHFLVNSRHMWTTYLVSRADGSIVWQINGQTGGDFGLLPDDGYFRWTHHARAHNVSADNITISWLDNHRYGEGLGEMAATPTRGLALQLQLPPSRAQSPRLLQHTDALLPHRFYSPAHGSYELDLQHGNQFLCLGDKPLLLELGAAGDLRWRARFGDDNSIQAYRASKHVWHATPKAWDPSLVLQTADETLPENSTRRDVHAAAVMVRGYVSWNGATDIDSWEVYSGRQDYRLSRAGRVLKRGFETVFELSVQPGSCVQVAALQNGREVRRSSVECLP